MRSRCGTFVVAVAILLAAERRALAVRPFITDDAHTVGRHQAQLETWVRVDRKTLQHWVLPAFGPIERLELTAGGVHGASFIDPRGYTAAGPLLQAKLLLRHTDPGEFPGIALIGGSLSPFGYRAFKSLPNAFGYLAATYEVPNEIAQIHANVGLAGRGAYGLEKFAVTWGVGTQIHVRSTAYLVAELFSGDPYGSAPGSAIQYGYRFILSKYIQLDGTLGTGLWGSPRMPTWASAGIRIVSHPLF